MSFKVFKPKEYGDPLSGKSLNVVAVVVTHNPTLQELQRLLTATSVQVSRVIVVDNGSREFDAVARVIEKFHNTQLIGLPENMGIAHAQNVGFRTAHSQSADYILTLDQDSVPEPTMVRILTAVFQQTHGERPIAAVGPVLLDENTQLPLPFFSFQNGRKKRITPTKGNYVLEVDFLVSSGTLLATSTIIEIGLMREELFISYVDVEWCLRARSRGYKILACCAVFMTHNLGERRLKIGRFLIPLHSPLRHFYLMRSGMYMQRLSNVSVAWKRADLRQLIRSFILFSIAGLPRCQELILMCRGVKEGLRMKIEAPIYLREKDLAYERVEGLPLRSQEDCPYNNHVAVLMALYGGDHPDLFERALISVLKQTLPHNFELHVYLGIDGPISPELESVVKKYETQLYLVSRSTENIGLARTLNRLISARGSELYFFRMDADDVSLPGRFFAQLTYLETRLDIDILGTAINECTSEGSRRLVHFAKGPEESRRNIYWRVPVAHPTVCIRRRVFDWVNNYPVHRGNEDIAMWFKCLEQGFRFDNLSDAWLDFTITDSFWKRRSIHKSFVEFQTYVEGIWRLDGITWRYIFPLARLLFRLSPKWLSQILYASRLRR